MAEGGEAEPGAGLSVSKRISFKILKQTPIKISIKVSGYNLPRVRLASAGSGCSHIKVLGRLYVSCVNAQGGGEAKVPGTGIFRTPFSMTDPPFLHFQPDCVIQYN